jgi:hypothetical protein
VILLTLRFQAARRTGKLTGTAGKVQD